MNLNKKISLTMSALIILIMLTTAIIVSVIINRQNQEVSNRMIVKSFNLIEDIIDEEQDRLGKNTSQMAAAGNMGEKIRFLAENRDILGYLTVREMYENVALTVFNAGRTAGIWKAAVYDHNSNLICFVLFEKNMKQIGYVHHRPQKICKVIKVKGSQDVNFISNSWIQVNHLPDQIRENFESTAVHQLNVHYDILDHRLCLNANAPIVAQTYNPATDAFEMKQWGVVQSVKRLDTGFIKKAVRLTDSHVNVFIGDDFAVGSLESYRSLMHQKKNMAAETRNIQPVLLNTVRLPDQRYFQGILNIRAGLENAASIVVLQSSRIANENAWQVSRILLLVTLAVLIVLLPVVLYLVSRFFIRPVVRLTSITSKIADGDLDKQISVSGRDELGTLARSFSVMQESIRTRMLALKKAEEKYRNLFEFAPDGICISTIKGRILSGNDVFLKMTGLQSKEKLYRTDVTEYHQHPEKREEMLRLLARKKVIRNFNIDFRSYAGAVWPAQVSLRAINYENEDAILAIIRDLSEEKKAQSELYYLRTLLGNIIDAIPSAIIGIDRNIRIILWNEQARQMFHLSSEEAIGQLAYEVIPVINKKLDQIAATVFKQKVFPESKMHYQVDGEIRFLSTAVYPLSGGHQHEAVIRIDDITEKVRLEEMIIQSEKMVSLGGLAAGMAHEINNPLAGILQNAYVLKNRLTGDLLPNRKAARECGMDLDQIRSYVDKRQLENTISHITKSGKRAAEIVTNMLSFARMEKTEMVDCRMDMLLDDTVELAKADYNLKKKYDFRKIKIEKDYMKDIPPVRCSKAKIQQTFFNILQNGAQAMAVGGTYDGGPPAFVLKILYKKDQMLVSIRDNGPGMNAATRKRIFEPFFTTKAVGTGTGLGMSVSYFIITQDHGGTLSVRSVPMQGAEFIISLPIKPETAE